MTTKSFNSKTKRRQLMNLIEKAKDVEAEFNAYLEDVTTPQDNLKKYKQCETRLIITATF